MRRNDQEFEHLQATASDMTADQHRRVIEFAARRSARLCHDTGVLVLRGELQAMLEPVA
jgi:hypothetical protein